MLQFWTKISKIDAPTKKLAKYGITMEIWKASIAYIVSRFITKIVSVGQGFIL